MRNIGVAVAHPDPGVVDELVNVLEAADDLYLAIEPAKAAVVVADSHSLQGFAGDPVPDGTAVVGLAETHDVAEVARAALQCRAYGLVVWPQDRPNLRTMLRDAASRARLASGGAEGRVVAFVGARGGVGTTTLAAMLARASADAAVIDLDVAGAGQSAFLSEGAEPTLPDVMSAVDDLDPDALRAAFSTHAAGRALCLPPRTAPPPRQTISRLVSLLRATVPVAVCDAGRGSDETARALIADADLTVCVCAPDVASMRGARLLGAGPDGKVRVVLNRAERARLGARGVARVLGERPCAVIPSDGSVRRAGEAGRLPERGPARRAIERLAAELFGKAGHGS